MLFFKLFRKVDPSCAYCRRGTRIGERDVVCLKHGIVPVEHHCRAFRYDPLKRTPPRPALLRLGGLGSEDFMLDAVPGQETLFAGMDAPSTGGEQGVETAEAVGTAGTAEETAPPEVGSEVSGALEAEAEPGTPEEAALEPETPEEPESVESGTTEEPEEGAETIEGPEKPDGLEAAEEPEAVDVLDEPGEPKSQESLDVPDEPEEAEPQRKPEEPDSIEKRPVKVKVRAVKRRR